MSHKGEYKSNDVKEDKRALQKCSSDEEIICYDEKGTGEVFDMPVVEILEVIIDPSRPSEISSSLKIQIRFNLDRDVVAGYWSIRFLVDSSHKRIIKLLGDTPVEDYPDGESDMNFSTDIIDVGDIEPSILANSGLLMAVFIVNGEEVASVNMVMKITTLDTNLI